MMELATLCLPGPMTVKADPNGKITVNVNCNYENG